MENSKFSTRQSQINHLYNQDAVPEDSEITSFYYHKTLALQSFVALFSLFSISLNLIEFVFGGIEQNSTLLTDFGLILTALGIITMIFERLSKIRWIKQTKQIKDNTHTQILDLIFKIILFIPTPSYYTNSTFTITTYDFQQKQMNINSLLTFYALINRFFYIIKFLVHSQLYYGSRPDRLSRLYTVEFGTFNAVKFLINEKPLLVILTTMTFNFVVLPFTILALESEINPALDTFISCLHFVLVTQVTVGYGDLNVLSIFGRCASICIVMIGITYTSLLLILFVRAMQLNGQEEEAHYLLQALQRKIKVTKSRVKRIENEWIFSNMYYPPDEREKKREEINIFRYNNRRDILFDRENNINVKRMMLSNFSEIFQYLSQIQEKHNIIAKCLEVISNKEDRYEQLKKNSTHIDIDTEEKQQLKEQMQVTKKTLKEEKNHAKFEFGDDIIENL